MASWCTNFLCQEVDNFLLARGRCLSWFTGVDCKIYVGSVLLIVEKQGTYLHVYGSSEAALVLAFYINCPTLITKQEFWKWLYQNKNISNSKFVNASEFNEALHILIWICHKVEVHIYAMYLTLRYADSLLCAMDFGTVLQ